MGNRGVLILVMFLLVAAAAACGPGRPAATAPPTAQVAAASPIPTALPTPAGPTAYPWPPTRTPEPTRGIPKHLSPTDVPFFVPTATPAPPPIMLGWKTAPPEQWVAYVSTTVFTAPVGSGDGEIGYETPICCGGGGHASRYTVDEQGNIHIVDRINRRVVQFDPAGEFIRSIPYSGTVGDPWHIAANAAGEDCLVEASRGDAIRCLDAEGHVMGEYAEPPWLDIYHEVMVLDGDGTLWVQGYTYLTDVLQIEWDPYPWLVVPLGDRQGAFSEKEQRARAVPGMLAPGGRAYIAWGWQSGGPTYLYNERGERTYELPAGEYIADIDAAGNIYTIADTGGGGTYTTRVRVYSRRGLLLAELTIAASRYAVQVHGGAVYWFAFDQQSLGEYGLVRWEKK